MYWLLNQKNKIFITLPVQDSLYHIRNDLQDEQA